MEEEAAIRSDMVGLLEGFPSLKQILRNIKQVVWILDKRSDQVIYISPAFAIVWERSLESFYNDPSTLIQSIHPEDRVKVLSANLDDRSKVVDQSYRILRPDGSLRWISSHTFVIQEDNTDASYQVCIAQDITDQNQVDQTLRRSLDRSRELFTLSRRMSLARKPEAVLKTLMSASELRTAKRALIMFFESPSRGPIHGITPISSWSSAAYPTTSDSSEVLAESSLLDEFVLLEIFHPSKPVIVKEIFKDQRFTLATRNWLLKGHIHSAVIFPLVALGNWLGCLVVLFVQEKQFEPIELHHIKVLVDQATITLHNLQLLEIEAESRHEAERANEIKTRFLAMISHELRTPLTSIKGFTTTLLAEDVTWEPEEQRDFIETIGQEANRLQELIDHLLDLSRLDAGMLPIALEAHSFQDILQDALPQFRVMTQNHELSYHLPENLPFVLVDVKRIAQVLVNLVHNASLYTPKGTQIILSASVRAGFVQVSVIDQGPGIPQAERKRVFQAFQRGHHEEINTGSGAGLGLAICKGLVEAHGGRIWIKKQSTPGTTIAFTIPLVPTYELGNPPGKA